MTRAISVLGAVIVLLIVGWFFGHRPVSRLETTLKEERAACSKRTADLEAKARAAEARGYLWTAGGELILAAQDVEKRNFGTAASRAARARDLLTEAAEALALAEELAPVREGVQGALARIEALEPDAGDLLREAAVELNRFLESEG